MNVFNLFGKLSLDKSDYTKSLNESVNLTKEKSNQLKKNFNEIRQNAQSNLKSVIESYANGSSSFEDFTTLLKDGLKDIEEVNKAEQQLGLQTEELSAKTDKASKAMGGFNLKTTAIIAVIIAGIKKIADLANETARYADNIGDMAEKYGFTTKEIQQFDYWANQNGTTLDALTTGMKKMVNQAQANNKAFEQLGVSVYDNNGQLKDQKQLFLETITALQAVENQTQKNALIQDIFGQNGQELGQIINKDANELHRLSQEAEDYGLIISDKAINASSNFEDALGRLKMQFTSLMAEMLTGSPEAEQKFEAFLDNLARMIEKYAPVFARFATRVLIAVFQAMIKILPQLNEELSNAFMEFDWEGVGKAIGSLLWKGFKKNFKEKLLQSVGKGWLWGRDDDIETHEFTKISTSYGDSSSLVDRSNYNVNIQIDSSGYTDEQAKDLAEEVIRQIATQKQASGR